MGWNRVQLIVAVLVLFVWLVLFYQRIVRAAHIVADYCQMPLLVVVISFLVFRELCYKLVRHVLPRVLGDMPDVLAAVWVGVYDSGGHESVAPFKAEAVADRIHVVFQRDGVSEVLRGDVDGRVLPVPRPDVFTPAFRAFADEIPTVAAGVAVCLQVIYADGTVDGAVRVRTGVNDEEAVKVFRYLLECIVYGHVVEGERALLIGKAGIHMADGVVRDFLHDSVEQGCFRHVRAVEDCRELLVVIRAADVVFRVDFDVVQPGLGKLGLPDGVADHVLDGAVFSLYFDIHLKPQVPVLAPAELEVDYLVP